MLDGPRPPSQRGASRVRILHGSLRLSSEPRTRLSKRVQQPVQQPRYRHLPGDAVTCSRRSSQCAQVRPCAASGWDLKSAAPKGHRGSNPLPASSVRVRIQHTRSSLTIAPRCLSITRVGAELAAAVAPRARRAGAYLALHPVRHRTWRASTTDARRPSARRGSQCRPARG